MRSPGPVYDNAMRWLAADDVRTMCAWLGIDAGPGAVRLSEALAAATVYADLVVRCAPDRLAHVEFVRDARSDLGLRMLEYRARIMVAHPGAGLTQHVVVLGRGRVPTVVRDGQVLVMRLHVTYLRRHDPEDLLASASLAPLACLGRLKNNDQRAGVLRRALEVISATVSGPRLEGLALVAATLAGVYLDAPGIIRP